MEKLLLDTSYFIAYLNKNDKYHSEALLLSKKFAEYECVITDYILDELLTFLIYHVSRNYAINVAKTILSKVDNGELTLYMIDIETLSGALNYLTRYDKKLISTYWKIVTFLRYVKNM
ncbi:MAG: PIN domain nuclease [Sulfolobaceae archaeon]